MSVMPKLLKLSKQRGVSLIEVLVALLILSIGLVGLAGLQSLGLKSNSSAELRTQATVLAYDIIDSMRTNRNSALTTVCYKVAFSNKTPGCSPASALVTNDLSAWKDNLAAALPSGDGKIEIDDTGTQRVMKVTVQWDDTRAGGTTTQQLSIDTEL